MVGVRDMDRRALDLGVAREPGADEPAVPRPLILRVARRVDADKTAAGADVSLKGGLLARIEDVAGRVEEYDGLLLSQGRVAEPLGVIRAVHRKPVLGPQRLDRRNPLRDRIVAKSGGLGEDEDAEPRIAALRCKAAIKRHAEECGENKKSCGAARQQAPRLLVDRVRLRSYFATDKDQSEGISHEVEDAGHH